MNRIRRKAGFSLLELLIVISLIGVATGLGTVMFSRMTDLWRQARVRAELDMRADGIFELMARDLAAVSSSKLSGVSVRGTGQSTREKQRFGMADLPDDTIVIPVLSVAGSDEEEQSKTVQYQIDRSGGSHTLVRTVGGLSDEAPGQGRLEVASGVVGMRIEYANGKGSEDWVGSWSAGSLPEAVRISLTLIDPNGSEQVSRKAVFPLHVD